MTPMINDADDCGAAVTMGIEWSRMMMRNRVSHAYAMFLRLRGIMMHENGDVLCMKIRIFDYKQARHIPALKSKCIFCGRVCSAGKSSDNVMSLPK